MPGLDDARMHRPDGHFVDLFAFHLEKVGHPDLTGCRGRVRIRRCVGKEHGIGWA